MPTTITTQIHGLFEEILGRIAALQLELRRLDEAGHAHPWMQQLCELLDSLESSLCWDLEDDLQRLAAGGRAPARRILDWLRADIEPIGRLAFRLDVEAHAHPLTTVSMLGCSEIIERYLQVEQLLAPAQAGPGAAMQAAA